MHIDAVVTWVDGSDPDHIARRARYTQMAPDLPSSSTGSLRFSDSGELRWCLESLVRFAPWLRHIHVVTDGQMPPYIDVIVAQHPRWKDRIRVVDHREVFAGFEDLLPSFNSLSIETMMYRIPALAEHFLYFNDDFCLARPARPDAFFDDGVPVLQGELRWIAPAFALRLKKAGKRLIGRPERAGFHRAQREGARMTHAGRRFLAVGHHPHPLRRSTLAAFFAEREPTLRAQAAPRFRHADQISPVGLANALEMAKGGAVRPEPAVGYFTPTKPSDEQFERDLETLVAGGYASACVQNLEMMPAWRAVKLHAAFDEMLGGDVS